MNIYRSVILKLSIFLTFNKRKTLKYIYIVKIMAVTEKCKKKKKYDNECKNKVKININFRVKRIHIKTYDIFFLCYQ